MQFISDALLRRSCLNKNIKKVLDGTDLIGNDHNQHVSVLCCGSCRHHFRANGPGIWPLTCPVCGGSAVGLTYWEGLDGAVPAGQQ